MTRYRVLQTPVFESLVKELMGGVGEDDVSLRAAGRAHRALWSIDSAPASAEIEPARSLYDPDAFQPDADDQPKELPTDPDSIFAELGLKPGLTSDQIATIRRGFAMRNHPDRFPQELQKNATERMMIANALCDGYPLKKS